MNHLGARSPTYGVALMLDSLTSGSGDQIARMLRRFEAIGDNCEFGLFLRHYGVEIPGLLRWGSFQHGFDGLMEALASRFEECGREIIVFPSGPETDAEAISFDTRHRISFHTDRKFRDIDFDLFVRNESARLSYLARNLVENLEEAATILVYKNSSGISRTEIERLHRAIDAFGPTWLLWVESSDDARRHGCVEMIGQRLMRGWLDQFGPPQCVGERISFELWLQVCSRASDLAKAELPNLAAGTSATGYLDHASADTISGWAYSPERAEERVAVEILDGTERLGVVLADEYRADLATAGLGDGHHAFSFRTPALNPLLPHVIRARVLPGNHELQWSPKLIDAVLPAAEPAMAAMGKVVDDAALASAETAQAMLDYLQEQVTRLWRARAELLRPR